MRENTTLQNKVEKLQNDYDTVCSQLRQKEMHLEDLKANLSEMVNIIIIIFKSTLELVTIRLHNNYYYTFIYNVIELYFIMYRKTNVWTLIRMKKKQTIYVLMLMY